ncbi:MAG: hypothetical protein K940chlam3_00804 [Chlamydiae bacterium]|nr:hypothetical protein [Chlamydiota bacterium]
MIGALQDIATVHSNLYCLKVAFDEDRDYRDMLTPSQHGGVLYVNGLFKICYNVYYLGWYGKEKKEAALQNVIQMTYQSLHHYLTADLSEWESIEYQNLLYDFVKKELHPNRERYLRLFQDVIGEDTTTFHDILTRNHLIKRQNTLAHFEHLTGQIVPREIFKAIYQQTKLSIRETAALKDWISHINRKSSGKPWFWDRWTGEGTQITCSDLHKVVKLLVEEFRNEEDYGDEVYLVWKLTKLGCQVFKKADPKFLKKRSKWVNRGTVAQSMVRLELGRCHSDQNLVYDLVSPERKFVVISDNTVRLRLNEIEYQLKWVKSRKDRYMGSPPVPLLPYDPILSGDGFQVFDQFDYRMTDPPWDDSSKKYVNTIVEFFYDMINKQYTPNNLSAVHLGWIEGKLYTSTLLTIDLLNIGKMVAYLRQWTKGADDVYRYVLEKTYLLEGPEQEFFLAILDDMMVDGGLTTDQIKEKKRIGGPMFLRSCHWIWSSVDRFQEEVLAMRNEIVEETGVRKRRIGRMIKKRYERTLSFGVVDPAWKEEIMADI